MRRMYVGLAAFLLLSGAAAFGSDLASLAKNQQSSKQQQDAAARRFVAELAAKDPCYYPSMHGLKILQARMVFSALEKIRQEAEKDLPQDQQSADWSSDFFWQAPDLFFASKEPWMTQLGDDLRINFVMSLQQAPLWILDLGPFPFDQFSLEYVAQPGTTLPHLLKATPRDSNMRNFVTELYYDAGYRLQKKVIVAYIQRFTYFDYSYQPAGAKFLKAGFSRRNKSDEILYRYSLSYGKFGALWIPTRISIDTDALVDSRIREILPFVIELKDVKINQPIPEEIQGRMVHYTKQ